jgi:hypothetical protein
MTCGISKLPINITEAAKRQSVFVLRKITMRFRLSEVGLKFARTYESQDYLRLGTCSLLGLHHSSSLPVLPVNINEVPYNTANLSPSFC